MSGVFTLDLVTLATADATTNPSLTSNGWTTAPAVIDDYRIEGTNALYARASNTTAWTGFQVGTQNFTTNDDHIYIWINNLAPASTDTKANGGVGVWLSSGDTTWTATGVSPNNGDANSRNWFVDGQNTDNVGGFKCYVVDPRSAGTFDLGSPNIAAVTLIGVRNKTISAIQNGRYSMVWDTLRRGTGVTITSGSDADPVRLEDIFVTGSITTGTATVPSGAWGIITNVGGTYYGAGKLRFGSGTQTVPTRFRDTNQSLVWRGYPVSSSFYEIQITGSSTANTIVQLGEVVLGVPSNGCNISAPSGSVWNLNITANTNALLYAYASAFSQMRQGTIRSGSIIQASTFSQCGTLIVSGTAVIVDSAFTNNISSFGSSSLAVENSASFVNITNTEFVGNNVAIELVRPGTYAFDGLTFSNNTWDIWNRSGGQITINATNGSNPSEGKVLNSSGSTTTINNAVQLTLTGIVSGSEVRIYSAGTDTELAGAETVSGSFAYTYNYSEGTLIDVVVHNIDYVYYRIENYLLGDGNATLPIQQTFDRNYKNPA